MKQELINGLVDDVEEFDLQEATYQVWVISYNTECELVQSDIMYLAPNPEDAIKYAEDFTMKMEKWSDPINKATHYYEVLVETVVDFGDYEENVGTLFSKVIKLEK